MKKSVVAFEYSKLGEHADILAGPPFNSAAFTDKPEDIPLVKGENVQQGYVDWNIAKRWPASDTETYERFKLVPGDVVVAMDRPWVTAGLKWAYITQNDPPALLVQRVARLRGKKTLDQGFLRCLISSAYFSNYIQPIVTGVNVPHISGKQIGDFKIPMLPLVTQQKIAAILSAYDDLIANNQRRITLLERMAEDIYREWFVRLRFPGHEHVKIKKGIPQGWDFDFALKFFGHAKGKSYGGDELTTNPQHMPFITLKSFNRGGGYRADGLKYYSGRFKPEQIVNCGDVVMAVTDMTQNREVVGRVARVPAIGDRGAVISLDVIKLTPKTISASFLYSYMRLSGFGGYIKEFANGTNVLHLKPDLVTQQKVLMPATDLQTRFSQLANPIYSQIDALNLTIAKLESTRDALLPRLISGKLAVDGLAIRFPPGMASSLDKKSVM